MELIKIQSTFFTVIIMLHLVTQMTVSLPTNPLVMDAEPSEHSEFRLRKLASSRHGSYGTSYVYVPNNSNHGSQSYPGKKSIEVDPLTLIFGAKAIALKAYLISQFLTTTTTRNPLTGV